MSNWTNKQYGYLTPQSDKVTIRMGKGQNIAGIPVGILYIDDVFYPMLPGNVVNGWTYNYPVRLKAVDGLTIERLFAANSDVLADLVRAGQQLEREGVRAISAACGFFGNFQVDMAKAMNVPVAMSSLLQIPWIQSLIGSHRKIGVLTADASSITPRLLQNCGIINTSNLVIRDLRHAPEFSCILEGRGEFDNGKVCDEVVSAALSITQEFGDIGAILLECSDMPPYAAAIQQSTALPVFDFITLINWLERSVAQTPYHGFI